MTHLMPANLLHTQVTVAVKTLSQNVDVLGFCLRAIWAAIWAYPECNSGYYRFPFVSLLEVKNVAWWPSGKALVL